MEDLFVRSFSINWDYVIQHPEYKKNGELSYLLEIPSLRAESFYNVATAALKEYNHDGAMPDYHARSHGESFMDFILDNRREGLYLMDEPEAALSPQKQLELLVYLVQMCRAGSQFIIATHSPILLGAPDAEIWCFDGTIHPIEYEQTDSYRIMSLFVHNRERMLRELFREDR